jgi:hypothetical protein
MRPGKKVVGDIFETVSASTMGNIAISGLPIFGQVSTLLSATRIAAILTCPALDSMRKSLGSASIR